MSPLVRTIVTLALTMLVAGCEPRPATGPNSNESRQPTPSRLRVGLAELRPGRGNPYGELGPPTIWSRLFDSLTCLDAEGKLAPGLAIHWSPFGERSWRFELRPDIRFSNGKPCDAQAVAATLNWLTGAQGRGTVVGNEIRGVNRAEATDDLTVLVHTDSPDPILPRRLAAVMIVEPDSWRRLGPTGFAAAPVGTGPMLLERWDFSANEVILRANHASWRHTGIDEVRFVGLPERSVRIQALLSGDLDLAVIGHDNHDQLEARGFSIVSVRSMSVTAIALITEREGNFPLKDPRVRQALNYAVDKTAIAKAILGQGDLASGQPAGRVTVGHNPRVDPYPYDPELARRLLTQAGYPDGFDFAIDVVINATPGDNEIYQMTARYLNEVGVRTRLHVMRFGTWLDIYLNGNWDSDAFSLAWISAPYNDVIRPMEYYSCAKPTPFFCDRGLSQKLAMAAGEFDQEHRLMLLRELARDFHDAAPAIFLVEQNVIWAASPRVAGLSLANRTLEYDKIGLESGPR